MKFRVWFPAIVNGRQLGSLACLGDSAVSVAQQR